MYVKKIVLEDKILGENMVDFGDSWWYFQVFERFSSLRDNLGNDKFEESYLVSNMLEMKIETLYMISALIGNSQEVKAAVG